MNALKPLKVINPSTAAPLEELSVDDLESAVSKLNRAHSLFGDKGRHLPLHERIKILEKLAVSIEQDHESYAMLIAQEGGKPLRDARIEVTRAIAALPGWHHASGMRAGGFHRTFGCPGA